jgi:hypothetical protein
VANELTPLGNVASETALNLPAGLSREAWAEYARTVAAIDRASAWWVGDCLIYGEDLYGEDLFGLAEVMGLEPHTLQNRVSVARAVPPALRRAGLSWSHHEAVAGQPRDEQARLLAQAEAEGWSVAALRRAVKATKQLPEPERCPACGRVMPADSGENTYSRK